MSIEYLKVGSAPICSITEPNKVGSAPICLITESNKVGSAPICSITEASMEKYQEVDLGTSNDVYIEDAERRLDFSRLTIEKNGGIILAE